MSLFAFRRKKSFFRRGSCFFWNSLRFPMISQLLFPYVWYDHLLCIGRANISISPLFYLRFVGRARSLFHRIFMGSREKVSCSLFSVYKYFARNVAFSFLGRFATKAKKRNFSAFDERDCYEEGYRDSINAD